MLFDIPFYVNEEYIKFINNNQYDINSVYYRLPVNNHAIDARNAMSEDIPSIEEHIGLGKITRNIKKYGLLNTKIITPDLYTNAKVDEINKVIHFLFKENILDGIIVTDFMYLQKLRSRLSSDLASEIEVVPSVNTRMKSIDQILYILAHIQKIGFKLPEKIILDRSLNRKPEELKKIREWQRLKYPTTKIEIIVNEGCLPHCPYKDSHDVFISLFNQSKEVSVLNIFRKNACLSTYKEEWHYLTSPFIRPEDIQYVDEYVDILKIAGRTHTYDFIIDTFHAYFKRSWNGNLLQLIDTSYPVSENVNINNSTIPENFFNKTSSCDLDCKKCGFCEKVFNKAKSKSEN